MENITNEIKTIKTQTVKVNSVDNIKDNKYIRFFQEEEILKLSNYQDLEYLYLSLYEDTGTVNIDNLLNLKYLKIDCESSDKDVVNININNCNSLIYIELLGRNLNFENINKTNIKFIKIRSELFYSLILPDTIEEIHFISHEDDCSDNINKIVIPKKNLKKIYLDYLNNGITFI